MKKLILITLATLALATNVDAQEAAATQNPSGEAEAGIVSSNGNTRSESYLTKGNLIYKLDAYLAKLMGTYLRNESRDNDTNVTSSYEKWDLGARVERELSDKFSIYLGQNIESDKKAGIDRRYNSDIGGKYYIAKIENYYTFTELGYRYTQEEYTVLGAKDENFDIVRVYIESEKKWTPTLSTKLWMEYLPTLEDSEKYKANGEFSVNAAIDSRFSIKTAYLVKYDNQPPAAHKTDSLFSTSLIAKF